LHKLLCLQVLLTTNLLHHAWSTYQFRCTTHVLIGNMLLLQSLFAKLLLLLLQHCI
jgi:hypothetical protein